MTGCVKFALKVWKVLWKDMILLLLCLLSGKKMLMKKIFPGRQCGKVIILNFSEFLRPVKVLRSNIYVTFVP